MGLDPAQVLRRELGELGPGSSPTRRGIRCHVPVLRGYIPCGLGGLLCFGLSFEGELRARRSFNFFRMISVAARSRIRSLFSSDIRSSLACVSGLNFIRALSIDRGNRSGGFDRSFFEFEGVGRCRRCSVGTAVAIARGGTICATRAPVKKDSCRPVFARLRHDVAPRGPQRTQHIEFPPVGLPLEFDGEHSVKNPGDEGLNAGLRGSPRACHVQGLDPRVRNPLPENG